LGQGSQSVIALLDEKEAEKGILVAFMGGSVCEGSDTPSLNG
jgi:hypothetical protein